LLRQAAARNRAEQTQRAIRQAEIERERLAREIQGLHRAAAGAGAGRGGENKIIPYAILLDEDEGAYDSTLPLSKELQLHPWPLGYKPRIPLFNGKTNQKKIVTGYEMADSHQISNYGT
jgi:hypothetical protein